MAQLVAFDGPLGPVAINPEHVAAVRRGSSPRDLRTCTIVVLSCGKELHVHEGVSDVQRRMEAVR